MQTIKHARGRPSKYRPQFAHEAKALCRVGATIAGLAEYFRVAESTIHKWGHDHAEFSEALNEREIADNNVIGSLYKRAMGMTVVEEHEELRPFGTTDDGETVHELVLTRRVHKELPPDVTSQIFWLKNRRPEDWREKREFKMANGASVVAELNAGRDRVAALRKAKEAGGAPLITTPEAASKRR